MMMEGRMNGIVEGMIQIIKEGKDVRTEGRKEGCKDRKQGCKEDRTFHSINRPPSIPSYHSFLPTIPSIHSFHSSSFRPFLSFLPSISSIVDRDGVFGQSNGHWNVRHAIPAHYYRLVPFLPSFLTSFLPSSFPSSLPLFFDRSGRRKGGRRARKEGRRVMKEGRRESGIHHWSAVSKEPTGGIIYF